MAVDVATSAGRSRPLIVGFGNSLRGDDGVGIELLRRLKQHIVDADFMEVSGDATSVVSVWQEHDHVVAIDAAQMGDTPGVFRRIDINHEELPRGATDVSSHGFGLAQAIELARVLNQLPPHLTVFAVQGQVFGQGQQLSAPLQAAIPNIERAIVNELDRVAETLEN